MRSRWFRVCILAGMLAWAAGVSAGVQPKTSLEKVGNQVYCLCGCVTTLNHCPHLPSQCESRAEITASVVKDIQEGKNDPAILQDLARRYGIRVLAAPPTHGFFLAAWILPGVGLVVGLVVAILIAGRLRRPPTAPPPEDPSPPDAKILAAVEEEMSRIVPLKD
jgi:cytochrome c-type biogenesis protein CcmH/NrfF